jgi:hypothetical protein
MGPSKRSKADTTLYNKAKTSGTAYKSRSAATAAFNEKHAISVWQWSWPNPVEFYHRKTCEHFGLTADLELDESHKDDVVGSLLYFLGTVLMPVFTMLAVVIFVIECAVL